MTEDRKIFLRQFAKAQIVMYEVGEPEYNQSYSGWFFWNFEMESPTYEEWSYLQGVRGGWIPKLEPNVSAVDMFGTCMEIYENTLNTEGVVEPFPPMWW